VDGAVELADDDVRVFSSAEGIFKKLFEKIKGYLLSYIVTVEQLPAYIYLPTLTRLSCFFSFIFILVMVMGGGVSKKQHAADVGSGAMAKVTFEETRPTRPHQQTLARNSKQIKKRMIVL